MVYDEVSGESRVAVTVSDDYIADTNINGPGPDTVGAAWEDHVTAICATARKTRPDWMVIGGRPPLGGDGGVRRVLAAAASLGISTAIDMAEPVLSLAIQAKPTLVKVNRREATELLQADSGTPSADLARGLVERGACTAIVTDGGGPVCLARRDSPGAQPDLLVIQPPESRVVSAIGCGDCFLAGFLAEFVESDDASAALTRGAAVASAAAETSLPGDFVAARADELANAIEVRAG